MKVSFIIPTYNNFESLKKYLPLLIEDCQNNQDKYESEIIVVNDAGPNNIRNYLETLAGKIITLTNETNLGFGESMNRGFQKATGNIFFSLNDDIKITPNFMHPIIQHWRVAKENLFSVKPQSIINKNNKEVNESIRIGKINKGILDSELATSNTPPKKLLYSCAGACAYDANKLKQLGGFDPIYSPFYFEDFDLGYRALKQGWIHLYEPQSKVYHQHSASISKQDPQYVRSIFIRNREIFQAKNIHHPKLSIIRHLRFFPRIITGILHKDLGTIKGLLKFISLFSKTHQLRNQEKKRSKKTDQEIFQEYKINA